MQRREANKKRKQTSTLQFALPLLLVSVIPDEDAFQPATEHVIQARGAGPPRGTVDKDLHKLADRPDLVPRPSRTARTWYVTLVLPSLFTRMASSATAGKLMGPCIEPVLSFAAAATDEYSFFLKKKNLLVGGTVPLYEGK